MSVASSYLRRPSSIQGLLLVYPGNNAFLSYLAVNLTVRFFPCLLYTSDAADE